MARCPRCSTPLLLLPLLLFPLTQGFHVRSPLSLRNSKRLLPPRQRPFAVANDDKPPRRDVDAANDAAPSGQADLGAWVPVGSTSCLKGLDPIEVEIMGRSFVVWETTPTTTKEDACDETSWSVLIDECSHRLAPLSQGRIDPTTNCLECPYHGWQFNETGALTSIPHLEPGRSLHSQSRSVRSFETHTTGDVLWAFLPTSYHGESFPKSLLPEEMYRGLTDFAERNVKFYAHDMPCSYDFFVENTLDAPSHAHFAHHGFTFDRTEAEPLPCSVVHSNFTHLTLEVSYTRDGKFRRRRFDYQRPFYLTNKEPATRFNGKDSSADPENNDDDNWKTRIIFLHVPIRDGYSRMISSVEILRPYSWIPDWVNHILNLMFLQGDSIQHIVEINALKKNQRSREQHAGTGAGASSRTGPQYIHATSADTPARAWRQWWKQHGMATRSPPNTFGPARVSNLVRLDRQQLTDPWTQHTSKCAKCRKALSRAVVARNAGLATLFWSCCISAFVPARGKVVKRTMSFAMGLVGAAVALLANRIIFHLEGLPNRRQVGDRTPSAGS